MKPIPITSRRKPEIDEKVLIYRQWVDPEGKEHGEWYHAFYIIDPGDRRMRAFANWPPRVTYSPWIYGDVTHWMKMPEPPNQNG